MLDIDTLNALNDLMARTLYRAEVAQLPTLTRAEEEEVVKRARRGDANARASLIVSCLATVWLIAIRFFLSYRPQHDDVLDLTQIASLEMLMALDRALKKQHPSSYLKGVARKAMMVQTTYHSELIRKPEYNLATLAELTFPTVVSLETTIDLIEMAPPPKEQRFAPLYEALEQLTPRQRNTIARRYGVGQMDPDWSYPSRVLPAYTRNELRKALEPHLKHMLWPEQEE